MARILNTIESLLLRKAQERQKTRDVSYEGDGKVQISVSPRSLPGTTIYGDVDLKNISSSRVGIKGGEGGDENISIGSGGLSIESSTSLGIGGSSVSINVGPGGDVSASANTGISTPFGDFDIDVDIVKNGCTISVSRSFSSPIKSFSTTETYTAPGCKPKDPSPSPSPTPTPSPSAIDYSSIGDNCTVYACWVGKGYEYEHHCYLRAVAGDGTVNYYWDTRRQSTTPARGNISADFGVINPALPDSNASKFGFTNIKNGEESAGAPDVWMVNVGAFTDTNKMIRESYSQPAVGGWFVPGNFGQTGSLRNTGAWWKWAYSLLLTQYPAGVDPLVYVKCNNQPPVKFEPPKIDSPKWNSPPMAQDKCCRETASMLRRIMKFFQIEEIEKQGFKVPRRLQITGGSGDDNLKNWAQITAAMIKIQDHLGLHPMSIHIQDARPDIEGDQSVGFKAASATQALMLSQTKIWQSDGKIDSLQTFLYKLSVLCTNMMILSAKQSGDLQAIKDALGANFVEAVEEVTTPFNVYAGVKEQRTKSGQGFGKTQSQNQESNNTAEIDPEKVQPSVLFPEFLQCRSNEFNYQQFGGGKDIMDMLTLIVMQLEKINARN